MKIPVERRLVVNTLVSYSRTLFSVVLVLFSSRWALKELGEVDYGLYNLISSVLLIVVFFNTVISNGDARFFSVGIGKNDKEELSKVFNTSLSIHLCMPVIIGILGLIVGEYLIRNVLNIPIERIETMLMGFRIILFASIISMITVPFSTLFIAYQNIIEYTMISLVQTILIFFSAFSLRYMYTDKLLTYVTLVSIAQIITYLLQYLISRHKYECTKIRVRYFFDRYYTIKIIKYTFWNLLADFGFLVRSQGISVVVNLSLIHI